MSLSRRDFLYTAAAVTAAWPASARTQQGDANVRRFAHGVASGDPRTDRVIIWTRVSPPAPNSTQPIDVVWTIATDERFANIVGGGTAAASAGRDYTVKVDAAGLRPGQTYFYAFEAGGERSPVGRTRTLPAGTVQRVRLAVVSCSNYATGFFNVYRCLADRAELDAVLHVGDYIYEVANGRYGDGSTSGRVPLRPGEAVTLEDYRSRYATYRTDVDLQEAHRRHPFILVWDDHESADDAWAGGSKHHAADQGEWSVRFAAARRAYLEWQPIREREGAGAALPMYRRFPFGTLADLMMLDTRSYRDRQLATTEPALNAPTRTMLGAAQEAWLFDGLRTSQRSNRRWRLIGQQVPFAPLAVPGGDPQTSDLWDGYPAARGRIFDFLAAEKIRDLAILSGDRHSSWAIDVARDPWQGYQPATGVGSAAVELVAPAISSPPLYADDSLKKSTMALQAVSPHVRFLDGDHNGYTLVDVTPNRLLSEWYFVPNVTERSPAESRAASFLCERGAAHLVPL